MLNDNCSISVDRSNSGETLGNSSYFKYLKPALTDFDCKRETEVKIELILDNNSVEAFFFDWYSFTTLIFTEKQNKGIRIWTSLDQNYIRVKFLRAEVLKKTMGVEGNVKTVNETAAR
jgi:sucrose-6-phosphate hydrolase SacC (GH32 family)